MKKLLLFLGLASMLPSNVQVAASVQVNVSVVDAKMLALKDKVVLFTSTLFAKMYSCRTDAHGLATLTLPVGDEYTIRLKTLSDTTMYSILSIPALQAGHQYTAPFKVAIEFEPPTSFTLRGVYFDNNKATIRNESLTALDEVVAYMKTTTGEHYEIAGHTDNVGTDIDNLALSQVRANSVKAFLVGKGISANRITAKGYGAAQPIADNLTAEGRQLNRRTELKIL